MSARRVPRVLPPVVGPHLRRSVRRPQVLRVGQAHHASLCSLVHVERVEHRRRADADATRPVKVAAKVHVDHRVCRVPAHVENGADAILRHRGNGVAVVAVEADAHTRPTGADESRLVVIGRIVVLHVFFKQRVRVGSTPRMRASPCGRGSSSSSSSERTSGTRSRSRCAGAAAPSASTPATARKRPRRQTGRRRTRSAGRATAYSSVRARAEA